MIVQKIILLELSLPNAIFRQKAVKVAAEAISNPKIVFVANKTQGMLLPAPREYKGRTASTDMLAILFQALTKIVQH